MTVTIPVSVIYSNFVKVTMMPCCSNCWSHSYFTKKLNMKLLCYLINSKRQSQMTRLSLNMQKQKSKPQASCIGIWLRNGSKGLTQPSSEPQCCAAVPQMLSFQPWERGQTGRHIPLFPSLENVGGSRQSNSASIQGGNDCNSQFH